MRSKVIWISIFFAAFFLIYLGFRLTWQLGGWSSVRLPTYAGNWYVGKKSRLLQDLSYCQKVAAVPLDSASATRLAGPQEAPTQPVLAIIAPHAAYRYSASIAAHSYAAVRNQKVSRVFLLGPSHHVRFHGAVLPESKIFRTPLGDSLVDGAEVNRLLQSPLFRSDEGIQKYEHSLEMQIPFIQHTFGTTKIVPILIGTNSETAELATIARILKSRLRPGDLVIVSSDFTHWGKFYHYQPFENNFKNNIEKLDREAFSHIRALDIDGFRSFKRASGDTICGFSPICVLLEMLPSTCQCTLLKYNTSQETMGTETRQDRDRSISYMAIVFSGSGWDPNR